MPIFTDFLLPARIFFLSVTIFSAAILIILLPFVFESVYFLLPVLLFWFSVHIRFFNIICYCLAIFLAFWIYSVLFFGFLNANSLFFTLLFIYFLPLLIIINTYFWQQRQKYDFLILHYSAMTFSMLFFIYSFLMISWNEGSTLFISLGVFLLALEFFLSFFRFRRHYS